MGLLADDVTVSRRSAIRSLAILIVVLALGFGTAWATLGRAARFSSLEGVFLSFEIPAGFAEVDEQRSGGSLTSLGQSPEVERTYASTLSAKEACAALRRAFKEGDVDVLRVASDEADVECRFTGPIGRFSLDADVRRAHVFIERARSKDLRIPRLPDKTRSVASLRARS